MGPPKTDPTAVRATVAIFQYPSNRAPMADDRPGRTSRHFDDLPQPSMSMDDAARHPDHQMQMQRPRPDPRPVAEIGRAHGGARGGQYVLRTGVDVIRKKKQS